MDRMTVWERFFYEISNGNQIYEEVFELLEFNNILSKKIFLKSKKQLLNILLNNQNIEFINFLIKKLYKYLDIDLFNEKFDFFLFDIFTNIYDKYKLKDNLYKYLPYLNDDILIILKKNNKTLLMVIVEKCNQFNLDYNKIKNNILN